jgi:hypothetical protein
LDSYFGRDGVSIGVGGGEQKLMEARAHAKKYLSTSGDFDLIGRAAGLLAYRPWDEVEPYAVSALLPPLIFASCIVANRRSHSTRPPAGPTWPHSSSPPTTASTRSRPGRSSTSPSPPACPRSRHPPATRPSHRPRPTPPRPPPPSVPSVAPSSTNWPATCPTHTTRRVSSRTTRSCCPTDAYMEWSG